jgi:colanic acid/amylovoran biosynthesis protein
MNILITNAYTWYNKGDAAILIGMFKAIRVYIPTAEITVLSFTPEIDEKEYRRYNVRVLGNLFAESIAKKQKHKFLKWSQVTLKAFKYFLWLKFKNLGNQSEKEILKAYSDADIILSCGGGFLGGYNVLSITHVYSMYFGKLLKKPVVIWAQSIEPFGNIAVAIFTKFILNRLDLIIVREKRSFGYLKSLNIKPNIAVTADAAFLVDNISAAAAINLLEKRGIKKNKRLIGITVRKWNFPGHKNADKKFLQYLKVISKSIEYIISNIDATVILFPQVIYAPYDDDRIVSILIKSKLTDSIQEQVIVLTEDYMVEELKGMIGQMDLFIGTRMHSNIFAASMNVPTIAISYESKTEGIMEMLDLEEYVIDINTIKIDESILMINKCWKNRSKIKENLRVKMGKIKKQALFTAELVKNLDMG